MMRAGCLWSMLLLLVMVPLGAHGECRYYSGSNTSVTFSGNLSSNISIAANTPNGTVLATSIQATPLNPPVITCGHYSSIFGYRVWTESAETMAYGVVNARGGIVDTTTYETGIPGIGYRITHPTEYLKSSDTESVSRSTFSVTSGLQLVKIGSITPGSILSAGKLADWQWDALIPETFYLGTTITFTTPSCTLVTDPINVTLPAVTTSAFTGVGSISGTTPFQIQLNCPAGTAVTKITMHAALPDSHPGVIKPAGAGYAAGVGVRVLNGNSNPMVFGTQTVVTPPNATTSIPYFAQYFQTAPAVTGGAVKATVTFDIFYQ